MASNDEQSRTRCYWAILDTGMAFQYLDPLFQQHMQEQSSSMIGKSLIDFIHPEEKQVAQEDFAKFKSSNSIFGSVTRCRYARISHCRRILGAQNVPDETVEGDGSDNEWISARITSSLVAENTVLAFFHAVPEGDNTLSANWNNCGPDAADVSRDYMTPAQVDLLTKAFTACQNASETVRNSRGEEKTALPPNYVFQLLATHGDAIYFTWPPAQPTGDNQDLAANGPVAESGERYSPVEYAALAKSVALPQTVPDAGEASTNCTKRYQSKHPVLLESNFANVESVVITYQALTFVCFQSGGILLNRNTFSAMPDLRVGDNNSMKRKDMDFSEDEAMKRLRTANLQIDNQDTPVPILDLASWQSHVPQQGIDDGSGQQQQFPMQGNNTQIPGQWNNEDPNNQNNLQSPYYGSSAYPSVYSNMFSNDGRTSGFMGGSTNIPPMPTPSGPSTSNGLQNLALASTSSYYTDYNPAQFNVDGSASNIPPPTPTGGDESPSIAAGSDGEKSMVIHRVRKNDRGRICTSCGTTNSPEWRKGPSGIKTLCNACGLRYSRAQARRAKKAAKEANPQAAASGADAAAAANNNNANGQVSASTDGNISTSYSIPTPLQIPNTASTSTSGGPPSAGTPHSPYLPIGDYSVHAPLPPLPLPTNEEQQPHSAGSGTGSGQNIPIGNGNGSSYSNFVNYPYDQWGSPMYEQSFAAQQQQGQ